MVERPIGCNPTECRLPKVNMPVYQPGQGNHISAVDLIDSPASELWAKGYDFAFVDEYVTRINDSNGRVH